MIQRSVNDLMLELEAIQREARDELRKGICLDFSGRHARTARRLSLERAIAAETGQEYAESIALDASLGNEWHLLSSSRRDTTLFCGDATAGVTVALDFVCAVEHRFGECDAGAFDEHPLYGKGLEFVGFHQIHNSAWLRKLQTARSEHALHGSWPWATFGHYTVRGKRGEFSCIARGWAVRVIHESIRCYRGRLNMD